MSIYLNDFRAEKILSIYEDLKSNNKTDLIFILHEGEIKGKPLLTMSYDSTFHRIFIEPLPDDEPLYPNPDYIAKLVPEKIFLENIKPSEEYKQLMKSN